MPLIRPLGQCHNVETASEEGRQTYRGIYGLVPCRQMAPALIEEVRSMTRRLLLTAAIVVLIAVPVALTVFGAAPVNLSSHASTFLKCYDPIGNSKTC